MRAAVIVRDVAKYLPTTINGRCRTKVYNFVRLSELYYARSQGMDIKGPAMDIKGPAASQDIRMDFSNSNRNLVQQFLSLCNGSMPNAVRSTSSKVFVGGLSFQIGDQSLKEVFSGFGEITDVHVITDRDSGRSRGFGFVSFSDEESAKKAMSAMDGQELYGRIIRVSLATARPPRFGGGGYA